MAERRVRIDSLVVRMRGVPAHRAREFANGLGEAVLRELSLAPAFTAQAPGVTRVDRVDAGTVTPGNRQQAANLVATAVARQLEPAGD